MTFFGSRRQSDATPPSVVQKMSAAPSQPSPAAPQPVGFETVLGANSVIEGTLRSAANVRLDGTFTGTLEITGNVLVGETARINADINAKNISIAGAVRGNVSGKKVQILRTGRIWGDIHALALTTEEGAFIDGKISMVSREVVEPPPAPVDEPQDAVPADAMTTQEPDASLPDEPALEAQDEPDVEPNGIVPDDPAPEPGDPNSDGQPSA